MIGAGNIGRGFIGAILSRSGYHVTFADVNMTLIDAINAEGRYTVHIQDRNPAAFTITNIDGISSAGPELAEALKTAELVTTAVGLRILPIVAKPIVAGIAARKAAGNTAPLNIVACENAVRATSQLKNAVYALLDDETKEICKEIVRCGGLDGRVNIALDYFDASINRISAWTVGFRNVQKALLSALLTPNDALRALQDEQRFTELMVRQEALKTMPFGDVWDEYCRSCNVPVGTDWFETVQKYERDVLSKRV